MMHTNGAVRFLLLLPLFAGCQDFIDALGGGDDDPLEELELMASHFGEVDAVEIDGSSATMRSDRELFLGLNNFSDEITKVEVKRVIDGDEVVCELTTNEGEVSSQFSDWPGSDTSYTLVAHAEEGSREFGPIDVTVEAPGEVESGSVQMGDQLHDGNGYGPFFQSRRVGFGGGWNYANFDSVKADGYPRLLDFAFHSAGDVVHVVSPDAIPEMFDIAILDNDCGYLTTTFALYDGALDPDTPLTLEEIAALPDPPAGATMIEVTDGARFVYRTGDGKKGLIEIADLQPDEDGFDFRTVYSSEQ